MIGITIIVTYYTTTLNKNEQNLILEHQISYRFVIEPDTLKNKAACVQFYN